MQLKNAKRSRLESVALVAVFAVMLVFLLNSIVFERKVYRERDLISELAQLRSGLALYVAMEKVRPDNLVQLCTARYRLPGETRSHSFVEIPNLRVSEMGEILDPFKNPYYYDRQKPWIASGTEGFQSW